MESSSTHILDLRGVIVPVALLQVSKVFGEMEPEGILEIMVGDPETREDIFKVLRSYSYTLVHMEESESFWKICLKKKA